MFGYVKPFVPELKVCEYELYRAVYCGVCRALGKSVTCTSRLTLSYDFVFFALIRLALSGEKLELVKKRCAAHPMRKRVEALPNKTLEYTARAEALLVYYNLLDDINDKKGLKRFAFRMLMPEAKRMRRKALTSELPESDIIRILGELSDLEHSNEPSCDKPAQLSGEILGTLLATGFDGSSARIAYEAGLHTGRFAYLADACDDIYDDEKSGSYNPILSMYSGESAADIIKKRAVDLRSAMIAELTRLEAAINLVDCEDTGIMNIIRNIIYLGMPDCAGKLIMLSGEKDVKKKNKGAIYDRSL